MIGADVNFAHRMREPKMNEADPLRAPKRERLDRGDEARGDGAALGLVVALALCVLGAIFYVHQHPMGEGAGGAATSEDGTMAANGEGAAGDGMQPGVPFTGTRKEMKEMPLEKAKPIARDTFAAPVTHVTESVEAGRTASSVNGSGIMRCRRKSSGFGEPLLFSSPSLGCCVSAIGAEDRAQPANLSLYEIQ